MKKENSQSSIIYPKIRTRLHSI